MSITLLCKFFRTCHPHDCLLSGLIRDYFGVDQTPFEFPLSHGTVLKRFQNSSYLQKQVSNWVSTYKISISLEESHNYWKRRCPRLLNRRHRRRIYRSHRFLRSYSIKPIREYVKDESCISLKLLSWILRVSTLILLLVIKMELLFEFWNSKNYPKIKVIPCYVFELISIFVDLKIIIIIKKC